MFDAFFYYVCQEMGLLWRYDVQWNYKSIVVDLYMGLIIWKARTHVDLMLLSHISIVHFGQICMWVWFLKSTYTRRNFLWKVHIYARFLLNKLFDQSNKYWCVSVVCQWSITWWSGFKSDAWRSIDWLKSDDAVRCMWLNIYDGSMIISE